MVTLMFKKVIYALAQPMVWSAKYTTYQHDSSSSMWKFVS